MAGETKVFDVASPGSSKPDTGSKPMVVGHKNMLDPTLKGPVESESASSDPLPARREKTLIPTTENPEEVEMVIASDEKQQVPVDSTPKEVPIATNEPSAPSAVEPSDEPKQETTEETPEQKQKVEDDLEIERQEKLEELIKSKKYNAPIKEASMSSVKTFVKTFTIVAVVGMIVLIVLVDAEILDLGVKLPFNFL